jgi:hypothetical protein
MEDAIGPSTLKKTAVKSKDDIFVFLFCIRRLKSVCTGRDSRVYADKIS